MNLPTLYWICAIAGGTILIIKLGLMLLGLDHGDADVSVAGDIGFDQDGLPHLDGDHTPGFNFVSLQSIAGFFTMFGLVGVGLLEVGAADALSLLGGLAAGIFTAWSMGMIFLGMRRLQMDGTLVVQNAVGQKGVVYLTIPEKGTGVVSVTVQGSRRNMDAISQDGQRIPTGSLVEVVGVAANKILIVSEQAA